MVDLDSNPTKLIEIVEIGKQLLMTRGALTTFSIANDVAKYFAIIPSHVRRHVSGTQCAQHHAPGDRAVAVLSAVIFNALIIVALIPLALRGALPRDERCVSAAQKSSHLWPSAASSFLLSVSSSSTC